MNIYLIGYRCTGKSSVGKALAAAIGWRFIDLDDLVVETAGISIADIVARYGWEHFRQMERDALKQVSVQDHTVVATGGGIVLDPANLSRVRETGYAVWLKAGADTIQRRMVSDVHTLDFRPPLSSMGAAGEIQKTLIERTPLYRDAQDFVVETDALSVEEICRILREHLEHAKGIGAETSD
jgi:shikimate kinase